MTETERRLAELENMHRAMVRDGENRRRMMAKSFGYAGNTRRRAPDFGKPGVQPAGIDLLKAENQLRALDRAGLLTRAQSGEAWRRLTNLRPVETVLLK